jgi:hypothetical protein
MKLLLEKWNHFLFESNEQGIQTFKAAISKNKDRISNNIRDGEFEDALNQSAGQIVNKCPALQKDYVVDLIGIGTRGVVFSLESGRVLKLFIGGYLGNRSGSGELDFYKSSEKDIFSGKGKRTTLPVFDSGSFEILARDPFSPDKMKKLQISYAVMSKMITLEDYFASPKDYRLTDDRIDPSDIHSLLEVIKEIVSLDSSPEAMVRVVKRAIDLERIWHNRELGKEEILDIIKDARNKFEGDREDAIEEMKNIAKMNNIQSYELKNIFSTVFDICKKYGIDYLNDLHGGNIGVDPGTIRTKDPKFIIFDP